MKKVLCLIMVLVLCFSMCACRSAAEKDKDDQTLSDEHYYFVKGWSFKSADGYKEELLKVEFNGNGWPVGYSSDAEEAVIEYENDRVSSVIIDSFYGQTIDEYDAHGDLCSSADLINDHEIWGEDKTCKYENQYNVKGQHLKNIKYENDQIVWETSYRYNSDNKVEYSKSQEKVYISDTAYELYVYEYEFEYGDQDTYCKAYEDGCLVSEELIEYNEAGKIVSAHKMFYDDNGKVYAEHIYDYEYDQYNRVVKIIDNAANGEGEYCECGSFEIEYSSKPVKLTDSQVKAFSQIGGDFPLLISDDYRCTKW